jgi:diaminopimelate decarboxylase
MLLQVDDDENVQAVCYVCGSYCDSQDTLGP